MSDPLNTTRRRRIWIDTDPAITSGNGEVDDGFALLQALHSPEFDIVGISAVFGNTDIENTFHMAQEIVRRAGRTDIPVYKGHGTEGQKGRNPATEAMLTALTSGPLTIVALGPLSNVASALSLSGANLSNVEEVVFVGGRRVGLQFRATPDQETPFRDLNFELDPQAGVDLLKFGVPITLAGWEVSSKMWLTNEHLETLRTDGNETVCWLAKKSQDWHDNWVKNFKAPGFTPFDTLAVGWLLCPDLFEALHWPAEIRVTPERPFFEADPKFGGAPVTYLKNVDNERFRDDLMARLLNGATGQTD